MLTRRIAPIAALAAVLALPLSLVVAAPAAAATVNVNTWAGLQAAMLVNGDTVVLTGNITNDALENVAVEFAEGVTLDLKGFTLTITNPGDNKAAVHVPVGATLIIDGTGGGTLNATGGLGGAGIGGGFNGDGGTVTINGGTITATGGSLGAGIGGGENGGGGTVTINGGTVTATGGPRGAGFGGGLLGGGGTVTINGGTVTATGGFHGAGIGGGEFRGAGPVTINGGTVTAVGGAEAAGIGGARSGSGGTVTINGGTVAATGGDLGAGIGGGNTGSGDTVTINGGTVAATGGGSGAGIGGGQFGGGGPVAIYGGTVAATGGAEAAGIGGGEDSVGGGTLAVHGTPEVGNATTGGSGNGLDAGIGADPITNPTTPAGVGYSAVTSLVGAGGVEGGRIVVVFNYLVTFDATGGSSTNTQKVNEGGTAAEPADPTRTGYEFAGWRLGGTAYDFSTPVTDPVTLTATWTEVLAPTGAEQGLFLPVALTLLLLGGILLTVGRTRRA